MRKPLLSLAVAVFLAGTCGAASAQGQAVGDKASEWSLGGEWGLTGGRGIGWFAPDFWKAELGPNPCRWCDHGKAGNWEPPGWDRASSDLFRADEPGAYALASDIAVFGVLPASLVGIELLDHGEFSDSFGRDMATIGQAVAAAGMVNQVVKYSVGRKRPYAHHSPRPFDEDPDQNLSFYSGHTSAAFAQVVALATMLYKEDSSYAPWTLAVGLPIAAGVGCLRMAADKHYLTDVLVGAIIGSVIGWGWVELRR